MSTKTPVVVIDDEVQIRRFLKVALEPHGFEVFEAATGQDGIARVVSSLPELVILDLGLPDIDGIEALRRLRDWFERPIIILSVRDDEASIVTALDAGADDYLTKPFNLAELLARIRVAQRHHHRGDAAEPIYEHDGLEVDLASRRVALDGNEVRLTATEYELLKVFVRNAGRVLTHTQILKEVWGPNSRDHVQYLRVYVGHLRHKIEREPSQPKRLVTEPGVGYRFCTG